jgi:WD40 repeat protein
VSSGNFVIIYEINLEKKEIKQLFKIEAHTYDITSLKIHDNLLISTSLDSTICLWNFLNGNLFPKNI